MQIHRYRGTSRFKRICIAISVLSLISGLTYAASDTLWYENFEGSNWNNDWHASNGTWEAGAPSSGPMAAHKDLGCAATYLAGDYPANVETRLIRHATFVVPPANQNPRLCLWHWFSMSVADYGQVQIRVPAGTWQNLWPGNMSGESGVWTCTQVDLSDWADSTVEIAFYFYSHDDYMTGGSDVSSGWYIDEVALIAGPVTFSNPEDWEDGLGDWWAFRGSWEVGIPTAGPGSAYSGQACAGTVLAGNYPSEQSSGLVSPWIVLDDSWSEPRLRFWEWFSSSVADYGSVWVQSKGGSWVELPEGWHMTGYSGAWTRPSYDLSAYRGDTVRFEFYYYSHDDYMTGGADVSSGWYIDDIEIETNPAVFSNPQDWENGLEDWWVARGSWEVGVPIAGPGAAFSGQTCAGTVLSGDYPSEQNSGLMSPWIHLDESWPEPRLRFWQWFSSSVADYGSVWIQPKGGNWVELPEGWHMTGYSGAWTRPSYDLSAYRGDTVRFEFYYYSHDDYMTGGADVSSGWYIDDIEIETNPAVFSNPQDWENGLEDWWVARGVWEIGMPQTWPTGGAHEGSNCAGTILDGYYPSEQSSSLKSPWFVVPEASANPSFRFWHICSFSVADYGEVWITTKAGSSSKILGPYNSTSNSDIWTYPYFDLTPYALDTVQIAFYFYSHDDYMTGGADVSYGWYIDDILIPGMLTAIDEPDVEGLPEHYCLNQNFPNPFNPSTQIEFEIPRTSFVEIRIYDILGRQLRTLVSERLTAGKRVAVWDGRDNQGSPVSTGVYFYQIRAEDYAETKKMLLLK